METADVVAKAEAVARLWDLHLFANGTEAARQKRADVLDEAIRRLQTAIRAQP